MKAQQAMHKCEGGDSKAKETPSAATILAAEVTKAWWLTSSLGVQSGSSSQFTESFLWGEGDIGYGGWDQRN